MRSLPFLACAALVACRFDLPGDGIDGRLNVYVIDDNDAPVGNATIRVADIDRTTNESGLAIFEDVHGPQTISVKAEGFRSAVWVGANSANVTIPLEPPAPPVPDQATLSGMIPGWNTISVGQGHLKAAIVQFSQIDDLGNPANDLVTPNLGNICSAIGTAECNWTLVSRTGPLTVIAMIIDRDTKGTLNETDDTTAVIGWALRTVTVEKNVNQSGLELAMVAATDLETVTIDLGAPPAGLPQTTSLVGIEVSEDEVIQLPLFLATDQSKLLAPRPIMYGPDAPYRLTATAQTASVDAGAQSTLFRRGDHDTSLAAGAWLVPPTNVSVTRTGAAFDRVPDARVHTITWEGGGGRQLLEITLFDDTLTQVDVPSLVALPTAGVLTARVTGIGTDADIDNFSLARDDRLVWGLAASPPISIP